MNMFKDQDSVEDLDFDHLNLLFTFNDSLAYSQIEYSFYLFLNVFLAHFYGTYSYLIFKIFSYYLS